MAVAASTHASACRTYSGAETTAAAAATPSSTPRHAHTIFLALITLHEHPHFPNTSLISLAHLYTRLWARSKASSSPPSLAICVVAALLSFLQMTSELSMTSHVSRQKKGGLVDVQDTLV
jgi:hypothetical protein